MNTNNASLQRNQQNYEFTNQALEVCLKLLNGYELHMEDKTPTNLSVLFVRKGNNFSTYQRQNLVKSNSRLMAFAKSQAPMSEVDKIKLAVSGDVQRFANTPEAVKLANSVIGNFGAHAHFQDLYESGSYLKFFEEVCSYASPEQIAHAQKELAKAQLPVLDNLLKDMAQRHNKTMSAPKNIDYDTMYQHV